MTLHEEIIISNDVNQRVYCAVQTRQTSAHLMRNVDVAEAGVTNATFFQNPGFQINVSKHVIGDETDGEQYHQDHDQFQTPLLQQRVDGGFSGKNRNNVPITHEDDNQRYGKPSDGPGDAVRQIVFDQLTGRGVKT